jgi:hypothetical protein
MVVVVDSGLEVLVVVLELVLLVVLDVEVLLLVLFDVEVLLLVVFDVEVLLLVVFDVEVVLLVGFDVEVVLVVTQDPSRVGFFTLNEASPLLLTSPSPGANRTLYESPPVSARRMHPPFPALGGSTDTGPSFPLAVNLMVKTPLPDFLICACFTGPLLPALSLYLKPAAALPVQSGFPLLFVPCGRAKVCSVGFVPSARTVSVAPSAVGSPAIVFGLAGSFALPTTVRFSGVPGFFTSSCVPRMV